MTTKHIFATAAVAATPSVANTTEALLNAVPAVVAVTVVALFAGVLEFVGTLGDNRFNQLGRKNVWRNFLTCGCMGWCSGLNRCGTGTASVTFLFHPLGVSKDVSFKSLRFILMGHAMNSDLPGRDAKAPHPSLPMRLALLVARTTLPVDYRVFGLHRREAVPFARFALSVPSGGCDHPVL